MLMQIFGAVFIAVMALGFIAALLLGLSWIGGLLTDSIW